MPIAALRLILAIGSGGVIGLILGLVGGGGSILAVPLLVYVVGVPSAHIAIGTAAIAVALNAGFSLAAHARLGTVKWRCALVFAGAGVLGSLLGAELGKAIDGQRLLGLVRARDGRRRPQHVETLIQTSERKRSADAGHPLRYLLPRLVGLGFGVGLLAGFFGIGGGFLIVPALMLATGMALPNAIGTSLVAVTAFGLATAGSYASAGFIDWRLAFLVITGGVVGSIAGTRLNAILAPKRHCSPECSAAASLRSAGRSSRAVCRNCLAPARASNVEGALECRCSPGRRRHTAAPKIAPTPAVKAMASAPQNVTRTVARPTSAPRAFAPTAPNSARNRSDASETATTRKGAGVMNTISKGSAAPIANVAAEVNAAWTGRAVVISEMPSSSRAWAPRASLAINCCVICRARPASTPRWT